MKIGRRKSYSLQICMIKGLYLVSRQSQTGNDHGDKLLERREWLSVWNSTIACSSGCLDVRDMLVEVSL